MTQESQGQLDGAVVELAYTVLDHTLALTDLNWAGCTVHRVPGPGGLTVSKIEVERAGGEPYPPPAALKLDSSVRRALLSFALTELQDELRGRRLIWDGLTIQLRWQGQSFDSPVQLKPTTPHGQAITAIMLESPGVACTITPRLFEAVEKDAAAPPPRQAELDAWVGSGDVTGTWNYDRKSGLVRITEGAFKANYDAVLLGVYAADAATWIWSWGRPSGAPVDESHQARLKELKRLSRNAHPLNVFRSETLQCGPDFAATCASMAAHKLGMLSFSPEERGGRRPYFGLII